jgi:hypothetical protein
MTKILILFRKVLTLSYKVLVIRKFLILIRKVRTLSYKVLILIRKVLTFS